MAFANPEKLQRLPKNVQDILTTLSDLELRTLRAALSTYDSFDFLSLPREIRDEIYRLLLLPPSKKIKPKHVGSLPTSIMSVSHQLNAEAREILFRETSVKLTCSSLLYQPIRVKENGWFYPGRQDWQWPISNFRNIRLEMNFYPKEFRNFDCAFCPEMRLWQVLSVLRKAEEDRGGKGLVTLLIEFVVVMPGGAYKETRDPKEFTDEQAEAIVKGIVRGREFIEKNDMRVKMASNVDATLVGTDNSNKEILSHGG